LILFREAEPNEKLQPTGAAMLVFRGGKSFPAAPAAELGVLRHSFSDCSLFADSLVIQIPRTGETLMRAMPLGCLVVLGLLLVGLPMRADEKEELKKLNGTWEFVSIVDNGETLPDKIVKGSKLIFTEEKGKWLLPAADKVIEAGLAIKLDPSKTPKVIDVTITTGPKKGQTSKCIYQLDSDTLKFCFVDDGKKDYPTVFESKKGSKITIWTLKR
jgi:uncharacterized protein (TIGR03067 family)